MATEFLASYNYWRLFHCLLHHSETEEESARCKTVWNWVVDHHLTLKKVSADAIDLLGIVWAAARDNNTLPGYDIVRERAEAAEINAGTMELLKEYEELRPQLKVHQASDMDAVLQDCAADWEKNAVSNMLLLANRITMGAIEKNKKKLSGPRDAIKYVLQRIEQGLLVNQDQILRPINVNQEAREIGDWYDEYKQQKFLPTGIINKMAGTEVLLERSNFVGILGYQHDGKSTVARHILYHMAAAGFNVLHVSLENPGIKERNKYILLHAHNPKFNGEFADLTYAKFRQQLLTPSEREMLDVVGQDFEQTIGGQITIEQSGIASWETIKAKIEQHHAMQPLDAVCVDYLQLIDPPNDRESDQRTRMTSMIKDVRQFQMTFDGGRGLCLVSPVQGNEDGRKRAEDDEGVWKGSGVNNDKELSRSMDFIMGVFNKGQMGGCNDLVFSFPKDRDAGNNTPFFAYMTGTGWIMPGSAGTAPDPHSDAVMRSISNDTIGDPIPFEVPE